MLDNRPPPMEPNEIGAWIVSQYDDLRRLARLYLERHSNGERVLVQPTDLVHELFAKACQMTDVQEKFAYAARAFRNQVVDITRKSKRDGAVRFLVPFDEGKVMERFETPMRELMGVHEVLEKLYSLNGFHARIAELKCCLEFTDEQTAMDLGVSRATISREWRLVRAWLLHELQH